SLSHRPVDLGPDCAGRWQEEGGGHEEVAYHHAHAEPAVARHPWPEDHAVERLMDATMPSISLRGRLDATGAGTAATVSGSGSGRAPSWAPTRGYASLISRIRCAASA